ncbi:hypothetical protein SAMN06295945_1701 [Polynucleobacter meluiroseus]|uniref:Uncharacterized protein n=1 Tax=Polynucleobacter meluiroseus TaxID=1938814 RepID=A0A240E380_9BURK|nr:hypothetical protein [Polynucleobacter meluiroseus]SNX29330.1 hypothetical protein SAMN06295945_1701 [Polynucleobacter meluiroseus]
MNIQLESIMQTSAMLEMSLTCAVIAIWFIQQCLQEKMPFALRVALALIVGNLFFWPLGLSLELPLAAYVRGATGDLSVVTSLLLWSAFLTKTPGQPIPAGFKVCITLIALVFYPLALGYGMFDPYALGYSSMSLLLAVLVFALIWALVGWIGGVWILALAILAWSTHWHESRNLWDYLMDPFLAIWACFSLIFAVFRRRHQRARSGYLFRAG